MRVPIFSARIANAPGLALLLVMSRRGPLRAHLGIVHKDGFLQNTMAANESA